MKKVHIVWRKWIDCDGITCTTLDSVWSTKKQAAKHAKELNESVGNDNYDGYDDDSYFVEPVNVQG